MNSRIPGLLSTLGKSLYHSCFWRVKILCKDIVTTLDHNQRKTNFL